MVILQKEYTLDDVRELDKKVKLIPITYDFSFKAVFGNNLDLLKKFLLAVLDLDVKDSECELKLLNSELPKENYKEYGKTIDVNVVINGNIFVEIEINRSNFNAVKLRNNFYKNKVSSMLLERGDNVSKLNDIYFYQLNLNTENKSEKRGSYEIVPYDITSKKIYIENEKTILKFLEFYRKLYYTKGELEEDEIWLTSLTAKNFTELYEMLSHILSNRERDIMVKEVVRMSLNEFNIHEWEKEKCDELVRCEMERINREKIEEYEKKLEKVKNTVDKKTKELENKTKKMEEKSKKMEEKSKYFEEKTISTVKNMIRKNISIQDICDITGMSLDEIRKIEDSME